MPITPETYERVALEDDENRWELWCGRLRRKPGVTTEHAGAIDALNWTLQRQIDRDQFRVRTNDGRLRISNGSYYVPNIAVIPRSSYLKLCERPRTFEVYNDPVPFVAEVWSPSTGEYDVEKKFPEYRLRGDGEIWRIHPYERTVTIWRRQSDGGYSEQVPTTGIVRLTALPGVTIDIDRLWD
jgi:Uma2 family endonuclease